MKITFPPQLPVQISQEQTGILKRISYVCIQDVTKVTGQRNKIVTGLMRFPPLLDYSVYWINIGYSKFYIYMKKETTVKMFQEVLAWLSQLNI